MTLQHSLAFTRYTRRARLARAYRLRWYVLGSTWAHIGGVAAMFAIGSPTATRVVDQPSLLIIRLEPVAGAPTRAQLDSALKALDDVETVEMLSADHRSALSGLDQELLASLQVDVAALRPEVQIEDDDVTRDETPTENLPIEQDPTWAEYVHTEEESAIDEEEDAERISAHNTRAEKETRTAVRTEERGPTLADDNGSGILPAAPNSASTEGRDKSAESATEPNTQQTEGTTHARGGGGQRGGVMGEGSKDDQGLDRDGGRSAPDGNPAPALASVSGGRRGVPLGARPEDQLFSAFNDWQPIATRVIYVNRPAPTTERVAAPSPTADRAKAIVRNDGDLDDAGGAKQQNERDIDVDADHADDNDGTVEAEQIGNMDMVEDLRASLGWSPINRDNLRQRAATAGVVASDGGSVRSEQTAREELDLADQVRTNTRGTEVGEYLAEVNQILAKRWNQSDLDAHAKAIGVQGQVELQLHILPSGKVAEVDLAGSSGHAALDQLARQAVPRRLPRMPSGLALEGLNHKVMFRYRNPLIRPLHAAD
jgi:TonB family protein